MGIADLEFSGVSAWVTLAPFKVGDRVRFTVVERDDHLVIDALEKLK